MQFRVTTLSAADFQNWLQQQGATGPAVAGATPVPGAAAPAASAQPAAAAANPADGAALIQQFGCGACHTIPGIPGANGTVGPNLAGVASRPTIAGGVVQNTGPDALKRWIMNPPGLKPGTIMPNLGLTDDQATKIVAYLETLK
jgi:cytochrome c1